MNFCSVLSLSKTSVQSLFLNLVRLYEVNETSYCMHHFHDILVDVFKEDLCFWLVSVVLVFVRFPSVVEPVSILIIIIPVLVVVASLFISWVVLVSSVYIVISVVSLFVV